MRRFACHQTRMYCVFIFLIVQFDVLLSSAVAKQSRLLAGNKEYCKELVGVRDELIAYNIAYKNCSRIAGNLVLSGVEISQSDIDKGYLDFLSQIEEVTGCVVFRDFRRIEKNDDITFYMPKLRLIRGNDWNAPNGNCYVRYQVMKDGKKIFKKIFGSLIFSPAYAVRAVIFNRLREISQGDMIYGYMPDDARVVLSSTALPLPLTEIRLINYTLILRDPTSQEHLIQRNKDIGCLLHHLLLFYLSDWSTDKLTTPLPDESKCDIKCLTYSPNYKQCWGSSVNDCHYLEKEYRNGSACARGMRYDDGAGDSGCCHKQCAVGCTGPKDTDCLFCGNREYIQPNGKSRCMPSCDISGPYGQMSNYYHICVEHCPNGFPRFASVSTLDHGQICLSTCPKGSKMAAKPKTNGAEKLVGWYYTCQQCDKKERFTNPHCGERGLDLAEGVCDITQFYDSFSNPAHFERNLNKRMLEYLVARNCTTIIGDVRIMKRIKNFDKLNPFEKDPTVTADQLEDAFGQIERIYGCLVISELDFESLSFLRNLRHIEPVQSYYSREGSGGTCVYRTPQPAATFSIVSMPNLKQLDMPLLKPRNITNVKPYYTIFLKDNPQFGGFPLFSRGSSPPLIEAFQTKNSRCQLAINGDGKYDLEYVTSTMNRNNIDSITCNYTVDDRVVNLQMKNKLSGKFVDLSPFLYQSSGAEEYCSDLCSDDVCFGRSTSDCMSCQGNFVFENGTCIDGNAVDTCKSNNAFNATKPMNGQQICTPCHGSCNGCKQTSKDCDACASDALSVVHEKPSNDGTVECAIATCPTGWYQKGQQCLKCPNFCSDKGCNGTSRIAPFQLPPKPNRPDGCHACQNILYSHTEKQFLCAASCPSGTFPKHTSLTDYINDIRTRSTTPFLFQLTTEAPEDGPDAETRGNACIKCKEPCKTCIGDSNFSCDECQSGAYATDVSTAELRSVFQLPFKNADDAKMYCKYGSCPPGFYQNDTDYTCLPCNRECALSDKGHGCTLPYSSLHCTNGCRTLKVNRSLLDDDVNDKDFMVKPKGYDCVRECPVDTERKTLKGENICYPSQNPTIVIAVVSTLFTIIIIAIVIGLTCCCQRQQAASLEKKKTALQAKYLGRPEIPATNETGCVPNESFLRLVMIQELTLYHSIGQGFYGRVYKAAWRPRGEKMGFPVAVKQLSLDGKEELKAKLNMDNLMKEAAIMASVNNQYCVRLVAICMRDPISLITQYAPLGSLDHYLEKYRRSIYSKTLLIFASQIAKGMEYLQSRDIVHCDLAARNILVSTPSLVKITDFGLSRMLGGEEHASISGEKMPIRWLPPESLSERVFSHQSDVWSYGVTLWEMFTFGETPYADVMRPVRYSAMVDYLESGGRLKQPDIASMDVYVEMNKCWCYSPSGRPTFSELANTFVRFTTDPGRYIMIKGDLHEKRGTISRDEDLRSNMQGFIMESGDDHFDPNQAMSAFASPHHPHHGTPFHQSNGSHNSTASTRYQFGEPGGGGRTPQMMRGGSRPSDHHMSNGFIRSPNSLVTSPIAIAESDYLVPSHPGSAVTSRHVSTIGHRTPTQSSSSVSTIPMMDQRFSTSQKSSPETDDGTYLVPTPLLSTQTSLNSTQSSNRTMIEKNLGYENDCMKDSIDSGYYLSPDVVSSPSTTSASHLVLSRDGDAYVV